MRRKVDTIVGESGTTVSGALDTIAEPHVRFATNYTEEIEYVRKPIRRKQNSHFENDQEISSMHRKIDLFQAARDGNMNELENLYENNETNSRTFFNQLDPETKLTALHYAARFQHYRICRYLVETCKADVSRAGDDGMTPLHYVARFRVEKSQTESYTKIINCLIEMHANVDAPDNFYATPLHYACERNNEVGARILLQKGANIEAHDRQGMHPLHGAALYGSVDTARLLIEQGADVLATDGTGSIPFAHACRYSHYNILEMFFNSFPQHEKTDGVIRATDSEHNTLLHLAVSSADLQIVRLLLSKNVDVLAKRIDNQTAVHLCAKTGSVEMLDLLLDAGSDINDVDSEDETILHKAVTHNKENVLEYVLLKKNEKEFIGKKNHSGLTALLIASAFGHTDCVTRLLHAGAGLFTDHDKCERGPIHLASMHNNMQTLEILLNFAKDHGRPEEEKLAINKIDRYSRSSLHPAAELGYFDIVQELLKRGASLNLKDDNEYTPLMLACKNDHIDVVKLFIEYINANHQTTRDKLNIFEDRNDESNTALHIAAAEGHSSIIKLLIEQNCDLHSRNMISWLPIHCAARQGRYNSVRTLIEHHSPIDPVDKNQQTPLHLAAHYGHTGVVKLLLKHGAQIDKRTSNKENCLDLAIASNHYAVAEFLVNHRDWELILRNANFDQQTQCWNTPLRKLITKMPDIALIVLNNCCRVVKITETEQTEYKNESHNDGAKKMKKFKKNDVKDLIELEELMAIKNSDPISLTKDETQLQKLKFIYIYEYLDDQFLHKDWHEQTGKRCFEPNGILYPGMYDQVLNRKILQSNHPFTLMVEKNREKLLDHPLVHSLLDYKWKQYARYVYYFNFLFYVLFVASLTIYTFIGFPPFRYGITHEQLRESSCYDLCSFIKQNRTEDMEQITARAYVIRIFQLLIIILAAVQLVKELFQFISERADYLSAENFIELSAFVFAILFTVDLNSCSRELGYRCAFQWQIGAAGVFLAWLGLVLFIQKFPKYGIYVVMLTKILRTFSKFVIVFFLFIIGFALAFHMLLQNHNPFQSFTGSLLKTCVMMIGEFEYEGIFHGEDANYFGITYIFFIIFIIVMSIIIMNLLVGLAVDDIAGVMRFATVKRLEMQVKLTLDVERKLPYRRFFSSIRHFRTIHYKSSPRKEKLTKFFSFLPKSEFHRNYTRLDSYGLIRNTNNQDQIQSMTSVTATNFNADDKVSLGITMNQTEIGHTNDWISTIHAQINTKYDEFNKHMADLKIQQEKINNILQQFPQAVPSRQGSNLLFTPTTV